MKVNFAVSPAEGVLRCSSVGPVPPVCEGGIMLAELMSGKCSAVPWKESRGSALVLPCAKGRERQIEGRNQEWEVKS